MAVRHLGEARLAAFLRRNSYRGGKSPAQLLQRLRSAPTAAASLPAATLTVIIHAQVQLLRAIQQMIKDAPPEGTGPGGQTGATMQSSAASSIPIAGTSEQSLPGPAKHEPRTRIRAAT
jgi:hypothetical protein